MPTHLQTLYNRIRRSLLVPVFLLSCFAAPAVAAPCDCSSLPSLGRAANYPALGLGPHLVKLQGSVFADSSTVEGNVGTADPGGTVHLQGNASIQGHVAHEFGSTVTCTPASSCPSKIPGGIFERDMSGERADALAAAAAFAALTPTQTYGSLTGTTTIPGNGCINVIQVNGDIDIKGNREIRLSGTSEDYFVVNVTGDFLTKGTADVVLQGMQPSHVIFNLVTPGARVELAGNSGGDFTILNPAGEVYLHGNSGGRGAYYAGATRLLFQGNTDFFGEPFACGNASCPDPELTGANIQTPATPQGRSHGNSSFFYAFFDLADFEGHLEHFRLAPDGSIKDEQGADAVDGATDEFAAGRDPYWDAGARLRSNTARQLFTTLAGAREDFTTTNVSESDLDLLIGEISAYPNYPVSGVDTLPELRDAVVNYAYGKDAFDVDGNGDFDELRPAVLGDVFQSNPLFIGDPTVVLMHEEGYADFYNTYEKRDRAVYVGANDGMFHAFDAGAWYDPDDPSAFNGGSGDELFAYVPGLLLSSIKLVPRTDDAGGGRLAPAFVDGNVVGADAWLGDGTGSDLTKSADEWATVVIAAFREGGEGYLAIDATDPNASSTDPHYPYPKLLWEFTHARLAETWSRPVITRVKLAGTLGSGDHCGRNDGDGDCREQWVAIFGAGYTADADPNRVDYIDDPTSPAWSDKSKAIFMVALDSGQILAQVVFDASGSDGHTEMKYAIPSQPAVLDLDGDQFADIVLVGDSAGQLWKWDVSAKGSDGIDPDTLIDNWASGIFFKAPIQDMGDGTFHYRSMFFPASAAFVNGQLIYSFATGERLELLYPGAAGLDDNNRVYVMRDPNPTGASAIPATAYTEANLTDVTTSALDTDLSDLGFYVVAPESQKFVTDVQIFGGFAIAASYEPEAAPACGAGKSHLYAFELDNAAGYFDDDATPHQDDRHLHIGAGIPSSPRISVAPNPNDDIGFINTSDNKVLDFEPPPRDPPESSVIYWRQQF